MKSLRRWLARLRNFVLRRSADERLREEMKEHLALQAEEFVRAGMTPSEARRRAALKFGSAEAVHEGVHAEQGLPFIETLLQDVFYAFRMIAKSPGFVTIAILTMAISIGATTAIFSVVDATLLHPLPYPHPEQLVTIEDDLPGLGMRDAGMSTPEWKDFERSGIFDNVSPVWYDENNLSSSSLPVRVSLDTVAPNYFAILGVNPQLGRSFRPQDPTPGYLLEVVISNELWKGVFGGDPQILNRTVRLDTDLYRIVGVMGPGFHAPGRTIEERNIEVWAAAGFSAPPFGYISSRVRHFPGSIARLRPGLTLRAAQAQMDGLIANLQKQYPDAYPLQAGWKVRLVPLKESVVGNVRQPLLLLLGAVGLVLLIGSVNVANLLLARARTRGTEMAVRHALGASQPRLLRQLLTEGLLLSMLGGAAGIMVLVCTRRFLVRLVPAGLPRLNDVSINWSVLLFAIAASIFAGVVFGLAPALHSGRLDVIQTLKCEGRGTTSSRERVRSRRGLVVMEFALSVILVIAACLLLRSMQDLLNAPLGFNPRNVMTVRTRLPYPNDPKADRYNTADEEAPFLRELLYRIRSLPGVEEAAVGDSTSIPLDHHQKDLDELPVLVEGSGTGMSGAPLVEVPIVSPGYFHLLGMTLLQGRLFNDEDIIDHPPVAVINEAMAQKFWPNQDPLGKRLRMDEDGHEWIRVVGIVANARTESLSIATEPQVYLNAFQWRAKHLAVYLRGSLCTALIPADVRTQVQAIDPTLPVFGARRLEETVADSLAERRFSLQMVSSFAVTALLLAAIGIYGTISYAVSERTQEIGLRLALGAQPRMIFKMILHQGLRLAGTGAALGIAGALVVSHLMRGLLYGVSPADPLTFLGVILLFGLVALVACYIPAWRATHVDPSIALRCN